MGHRGAQMKKNFYLCASVPYLWLKSFCWSDGSCGGAAGDVSDFSRGGGVRLTGERDIDLSILRAREGVQDLRVRADQAHGCLIFGEAQMREAVRGFGEW